MRICVINLSGNVGKTMVAAQLLQPRLKAPLISVESINADASTDGVDVEQLRAREFGALQERVLTSTALIVDVGASNVEDFLNRLARSDGSQHDFDLWVVPVLRGRKQQIDTVNTLRTLRELGVPANRVRVVFNELEPDERVEEAFAAICALQGEYFERRDAIVYFNEVFDRLKGSGESLADLMADTTDFKAAIAASTDPEERLRLARRLAVRRLASSATHNLDQAYAALMAPSTVTAG
jgi:hypothetical protein